MVMMAVKALVVFPNPVHVILLEELLHVAMATIVIGLVHLAIKARIEM